MQRLTHGTNVFYKVFEETENGLYKVHLESKYIPLKNPVDSEKAFYKDTENKGLKVDHTEPEHRMWTMPDEDFYANATYIKVDENGNPIKTEGTEIN